MKYITAAGQTLDLADAPFASGGEGDLHDIRGKAAYVAKVYRDPRLAREREDKIRAMAELPASVQLPANMAWPQTLLFDQAGTFRGFVMKRVESLMPLGEAYKYPGSRVTQAQRLEIAISLAQTMAQLHAAYQAVGDGNPDNICITRDCGVVLMDCDSFAVRSRVGRLFRCEVCAQGYVAPELLEATKGGLSYRDAVRTFDEGTDRYVLAIHIARLLRNGAHPNWLARDPACAASSSLPLPTLDDCARSGKTPLFCKTPGLAEPPFAPDLDGLPGYLKAAFKQTLVVGHAQPQERLAASQWVQLLGRYQAEVVPCRANPDHIHLRGQACPYCAADARMGIRPPAGRRGRRGRGVGIKPTAAGAAATAGTTAAAITPKHRSRTGAGTAPASAAPVAPAPTAAVPRPSSTSPIPKVAPIASTPSSSSVPLSLRVRRFLARTRTLGCWGRPLGILISLLIATYVPQTALFNTCMLALFGVASDVEMGFCGVFPALVGGWRATSKALGERWPFLCLRVVRGSLLAIVATSLVLAVFGYLVGVPGALPVLDWIF